MSTWSSRASVTQRKTTSSRRRPRLTKVSGAWGAITAVIGLLALTVQSIELIVTAIICLLVTIVAAFAGQSVAVPTSKVEVRTTRSPGGKPRVRKAPSKPGTKPAGRGKCSARCRASTAPKSECECKSATCSHGSESGVLTTAPAKPKLPTKSQLRSKQARQQERRVVRSQRGSS